MCSGVIVKIVVEEVEFGAKEDSENLWMRRKFSKNFTVYFATASSTHQIPTQRDIFGQIGTTNFNR